MHYFFKNLLVCSQAQIRQTKYIVMMTKEGCTKIVNFMNPGAVVLVRGFGHMSCCENALSSTLSLNSTLIPIVFRGYNAALLCHC